MRLAKEEELKQDIEIMSENFTREAERKDAIVSSLEKDLEEIEEQYPNRLFSFSICIPFIAILWYSVYSLFLTSKSSL